MLTQTPPNLNLKSLFHSSINFFRPILLDIRKKTYENDSSKPITTYLIMEHVFHIANLLKARNIHLKYVEESGDTYVMIRKIILKFKKFLGTQHGLVPYSTINNKHWIKYLLMYATGLLDFILI
jgi:hypothetical protein